MQDRVEQCRMHVELASALILVVRQLHLGEDVALAPPAARRPWNSGP